MPGRYHETLRRQRCLEPRSAIRPAVQLGVLIPVADLTSQPADRPGHRVVSSSRPRFCCDTHGLMPARPSPLLLQQQQQLTFGPSRLRHLSLGATAARVRAPNPVHPSLTVSLSRSHQTVANALAVSLRFAAAAAAATTQPSPLLQQKRNHGNAGGCDGSPPRSALWRRRFDRLSRADAGFL